jgi:hypothetical protein
MAVGAFTFYNRSKNNLSNAFTLRAGNFRMQLHTSASNAATATLSTIASVTNEVTEANGYSSSGKALASRVWTAGTSAGQMKFDGDDIFWSANGGSISNMKFLVFWASGASAGARKLLGRIQLSTAAFSLSAGNRMTVQFPSGGIFTLA